MMNLGEKMSEEECDALVDVRSIRDSTGMDGNYLYGQCCVIFTQEADIDGDGSINYEEFYGMMTSAGRYNKVHQVLTMAKIHQVLTMTMWCNGVQLQIKRIFSTKSKSNQFYHIYPFPTNILGFRTHFECFLQDQEKLFYPSLRYCKADSGFVGE